MIFVGVSLKNPHETSLIHLENEGFKRLVAYAKCDCFAYKNAKSSFFTWGQAKSKCGGICLVLNRTKFVTNY